MSTVLPISEHTLTRWKPYPEYRDSGIRPGKPTDNGYIESFNGKFRDECLNQFWFVNLLEAQARIETWRQDYNQERPHSSLGYQTPAEFAAQAAARGASPPTPLAFAKAALTQTEQLIL